MPDTLTAPLPRFSDLLSHITTGAGDREMLSVCAPFTGQVVAEVPLCTPGDVAMAADRARTAQALWQRWTPRERAAVTLRFHDLLLQRREDLIDLMQLEGGKARRHAAEEVFDVANVARYYGLRAPRWLRPVRRKGALPLLTRTTEHRHPLGVVGFIAPWNYPLTLAISDAIPALLAGNAAILKPAEQTPLTALRVLHLLREAGLPDGVFQVITGHGKTLGPPLIAAVDGICFTGSSATGRLVAAQAGERLIPISLEMGGKNPFVVLDDADLDRAVEGAVRGCFANAGQLCVSFERIYVQRPLYAAFRDRFVERAAALRLGRDGYDVEMGSLVSPEVLAKVEAHVADAVAKGATVLTGGTRRADLGPLFYAPTVLENTDATMRLYREESFGPVVALYPFDSDEEAVRLANDSDYGLNASIWTGSTARGRRLAQQIRCGSVNVNEAYGATWGSVDAPIGGMKASGLGRRHGREGFFRFTEVQTISVQRLRPIGPAPGEDAAAYAQTLGRLMRLIRHLPGLR